MDGKAMAQVKKIHMSSNPYLISNGGVQQMQPTGEGNFFNNMATYGVPFKNTAGVVAGNTERLLRNQIGEWARLILFVLAWVGMLGFVAIIIWLFVIIAQSPNSPPIEAVQLIPGLVSVIAVGWILMMLETSGRIKFYIYTTFSMLFTMGALVIIILWYVYFTSFIFTCNDPDPATLAIFLCQPGEAENTQYAAFAFSIMGTMMTLIAIVLIAAVGLLAPPKGSSISNEMNFNYWKQAANLPTTAPRISVPNMRQYMPFTLTNRKQREAAAAAAGEVPMTVNGPYAPMYPSADNPWGI